MRKIETEEGKIRKNKQRNLIFTILMLFLLVSSIAGFAFLQDTGQSGNGQINNNNNGWSGVVNGQNVYLANDKASVSNISVNIYTGIANYAGQTVYIDSANDQIGYELESNIAQFAGRIQPACYGSCNRNLPERNCSSNIIVWRDSAENRVYQNQSCIFIEGDLRAADAFLYSLFGV